MYLRKDGFGSEQMILKRTLSDPLAPKIVEKKSGRGVKIIRTQIIRTHKFKPWFGFSSFGLTHSTQVLGEMASSTYQLL